MYAPKNYFSALAFALFSFLWSYGQEIYVAKNGNDNTNTGSIDSPYLTIAKAASEAVAGTTVFIREGTYEETLKPTTSGTAGNSIIFQSYPGEKVIISAMESLNGWTNDSGSIYKTAISFTSLGQENFVMNGDVAMDLARWPNNEDGLPFTLNSKRNTGGSDGSSATFNSRSGYLTSSEIPGIDWTGGSLFFYGDRPGSGWLAWKEFITSSSAGRVDFNITKQNGVSWIYTFHPPKDLGDFYLEGVKGALDFQNEWWFDNTTNELFVQLPNGSAPENGNVKMRRRRLTIDLNNRNYIEVRNLAVFGGAIELRTNSNNNRLYGISSFYGNNNQGVFNSFSSNKQSIHVNGTGNIIEKCEIGFSAVTGVRMGGNFNELRNCYIHDFNYLGSYDAPLVARGGSDNKIIGNTIFNGGRDGINYNGQRCEVAFNDVYRSNLIADDCATFYTVGNQAGTEVHHNWFHDTESRGSKSKAAGIYLDVDPQGFSVHHNVIWNTEWSAVQINWDARDIDIFNNTFINNSAEMGAWHKEGTSFSNVKVWNNLGDQGVWEPQSDKQNNLVVGSNVFADASNGDFRLNSGTAPIDAGRVIDGITDGFTGSNPDIGAYEFGGDNWVAGIDWNTDLGPAGLGCYGLPGEDCIDIPQDDMDGDGVNDANDQCPNTPQGDSVDVTGCTIFTLPADNFRVLSTGETCRNSDNGSITISATENYNYTATLQGNSNTFTSETSFDNVSQGDYTVCITIVDQPGYEQCFSVSIDEPEDLTVRSNINLEQKKISLELSGAELYRIELNNTVYMTDKSSIDLDLQNGTNELIVKTNKDCQGIFRKNIDINSGIFLFPNPFSDDITLAIPSNLLSKNISWELYSYQGKLVRTGTHTNISSNSISIDMSSIATGSYIMKIRTPNSITHTQLVKN